MRRADVVPRNLSLPTALTTKPLDLVRQSAAFSARRSQANRSWQSACELRTTCIDSLCKILCQVMKFGCVVTVVEIHQQTDSPSVTQHTDDVDASYLSGPAPAQLRSQVDTRVQTENYVYPSFLSNQKKWKRALKSQRTDHFTRNIVCAERVRNVCVDRRTEMVTLRFFRIFSADALDVKIYF